LPPVLGKVPLVDPHTQIAVGPEQLVILTRVTFRSRGTVELDAIEGS
jgi:hypothetical protein